MLGLSSSNGTSTVSLTRVGPRVSTALFIAASLILIWSVGAGRLELPISCSQSRRASHYATPRGVFRSLEAVPARGRSSMAEPQPSKLAMPVRSRSPALNMSTLAGCWDDQHRTRLCVQQAAGHRRSGEVVEQATVAGADDDEQRIQLLREVTKSGGGLAPLLVVG